MKIVTQQIGRLLRMIRYAHGWWPLYAIGLFGVVFQSLAFNYVMAIALSSLTRNAVAKDAAGLFLTIRNISFALLAIVVILPFFSYAFESTVKRITGNLRKSFFDRISLLPMSAIEASHSGDLLSRMTNDMQTAESAYGWNLALPLMSIVSGVGAAVVIFTVNPWLALCSIAIGIALLLMNTMFVKPLQKVSTGVQSLLSDANQRLSDFIAGTTVARIYGLAKTLTGQYRTACLGIRNEGMKRAVLQSALSGANGFLGMMSFLGIITIGSMMIIRGKLNLADLMLCVQMMNGITWMFSALGGFLTQLQTSMAGADRIFEILDAKSENDSTIPAGGTPGRASLQRNTDEQPAVAFEDVSFGYATEEPILRSFSAVVGRDGMVAAVGSSGSGKSTLFKLLLGFYPSAAGRINLFGRDLRHYSLHELRSLIAYVPQDSYLFSGSIRENIAYGRLGAAEEDIVGAAKAAFAHDFILSLPNGYDTQVGDRGARLSGGQRQRIAIARALLKNAPILLLDEATASLDSESEQQVQQALEALMHGRTTIAAAHRLSTIRHADKILVLENGSVAEEGPHDDLLARDGLYARLYHLQFQPAEPAAPVVNL